MNAPKWLVAVATMFFTMSRLIAQDVAADDILGTWLNEDKEAHIEIFKEDGKYFGKIVELMNPIDEETGKPKTDKENPDQELQNKPLIGILLLKNFVFDEDDQEWDDGTIYDPKNGKTYDCYLKMENQDLLKIRGYIGISLIGRTTYWTRVKD